MLLRNRLAAPPPSNCGWTAWKWAGKENESTSGYNLAVCEGLKNTEVEYTAPDGTAYALRNSVIEAITGNGTVAASSCITCHSYASFGPQGKPTTAAINILPYNPTASRFQAFSTAQGLSPLTGAFYRLRSEFNKFIAEHFDVLTRFQSFEVGQTERLPLITVAQFILENSAPGGLRGN